LIKLMTATKTRGQFYDNQLLALSGPTDRPDRCLLSRVKRTLAGASAQV
jgi:hypothetical protein